MCATEARILYCCTQLKRQKVATQNYHFPLSVFWQLCYGSTISWLLLLTTHVMGICWKEILQRQLKLDTLCNHYRCIETSPRTTIENIQQVAILLASCMIWMIKTQEGSNSSSNKSTNIVLTPVQKIYLLIHGHHTLRTVFMLPHISLFRKLLSWCLKLTYSWSIGLLKTQSSFPLIK